MVGKKKAEKKEKEKKVSSKTGLPPSRTQPPARAKVKGVENEKKKAPKKGCGDKNCPVHSNLRTHGRVFEGKVVSDKMQGTVSVEWERQLLVPKYERYLKRRTRVSAHNPPCIAAKKGDRVKIAECRPISKTVSFVVTEVLKQ